MANSKKPNGAPPASTAASDTSTLTGVPVSASSEPACAANTSGMSSCEGERPTRIAITMTTGRSAATAPLRLINAVSSATTVNVRTSSRTRLCPARAIRSCPAHAVTPVASRPALTTNNDAMKMTAGSPNPASECPRSSTPVAYSASAVPMATSTTGTRFETNSTTMPAMIAKVIAMLLKLFAPQGLLLSSGSLCACACRAGENEHSTHKGTSSPRLATDGGLHVDGRSSAAHVRDSFAVVLLKR